MQSNLFLTQEEINVLTGWKAKNKQIDTLRVMGVAFRVNGRGFPVITRAAVEGSSHGRVIPVVSKWAPAVLTPKH